MTKCSLREIPDHSAFVRHSLQSMFIGRSEEEQLAELERMARSPFTRERMKAAFDSAQTEEALDDVLRRVRREVMVTLIARDASGAGGYPEVVRTMTDLAEESVQAAVRMQVKLAAQRFGVPMSEEGVPQDLMVVGMGKLGGEELNVSSDIDLIFLYDRDGETRSTEEYPARRNLSNREFFERVARRLIPMLSDIRGCGFVFRVDMRLRPDGDSGPIVCSSDMLEEYLYTQGRDWERFAWLKGRIISAPVFSSTGQFEAQCGSVASLIRPFVYRKYVDFSAISSLASLHDMIRAEAARRELKHAGRGSNVKIGRGGIREIEFIAQTFQVIRGGRDAELRSRSTLRTLTLLGQRGILTGSVAERLKRSYVFLRNLEHAIQYVNDEQTQLWPSAEEPRSHVAALFGESPEVLEARLAETRDFVRGVFDSVFHAKEKDTEAEDSGWPAGWETGAPGTDRALEARIAELGYRDAAGLASRVLALMGSRKIGRSNGAAERIASVLVRIFEHCSEWAAFESSTVTQDEALERGLNFLEMIAGRPTYVALLYQYPEMLKRVGRVLASSSWAAGYLTEHPIILDELMDHRVAEMNNGDPVDWKPWREALERDLADAADDQERQLNLIRDAHHGAVFRLLMADIDRRLTTERLADHLSALADAVIEIVMNLAWNSLARKFPGAPKFAAIAYGKLGGKELGYASDLDLVYVYDDDRQDAEMIYTRLVRRMMSWLTMQTSSGRLFEVDLRLRPNGANVVVPFESWKQYERNEDGKGAWTWEHQALTRARFSAGSPELGAEFEAERRYILALPRETDPLRKEIIEMRQKMLDGHRNPTELFDIKHDRGGMVDIEFAVQYLVLQHSHDHPEMLDNFGNIRLLSIAGGLGLINRELSEKTAAAYRRYRELQREVRLAKGDGPVRVDPLLVKQERESVLQLWKSTAEPDFDAGKYLA